MIAWLKLKLAVLISKVRRDSWLRKTRKKLATRKKTVKTAVESATAEVTAVGIDPKVVANELYNTREALKTACINALVDSMSTTAMGEAGIEANAQQIRTVQVKAKLMIEHAIDSQVTSAIGRITA